MAGNVDRNVDILIVEDEKNVGDLLREILADLNRRIRLTYDGAEAIRELGQRKYDLVITDIMLPGATGMEVLREAKSRYPHILVIIITGYASIETAIGAVKEGAYDYLRKPFRLDEIKIAVTNACEKITLMRENSLLMNNLKEAYGKLKQFSENEEKSRKSEGENDNKTPGNVLSSLDIFPKHLMPPTYFEREERVKKIMGDLERLVRLKNAGLLDDEEFQACKKLLFEMVK